MSVNAQAAYEGSIKSFVIHAQDLDTDHHLFKRLLNRFELAGDCAVRRTIMQMVVDLFDLHSAIELQMFPAVDALSCEREAVYDLMEQVEGTDARSQLHFARGLALKRAFERYIEREEALDRHAHSQRLPRTRSNYTLLEERTTLVERAEQLLRLH